jgi:hypothetical protein
MRRKKRKGTKGEEGGGNGRLDGGRWRIHNDRVSTTQIQQCGEMLGTMGGGQLSRVSHHQLIRDHERKLEKEDCLEVKK